MLKLLNAREIANIIIFKTAFINNRTDDIFLPLLFYAIDCI